MSILYKNARNVRFVLFRKNSNVCFYVCVEEGVSAEPCSEIYRGESAGSEPEIQVIMKFGRELVAQYPTGNVSNYSL